MSIRKSLIERWCGRNSRLSVVASFLVLLSLTGCSNLTGWHIPGTEKSAEPTTKIYLICENIGTVPEGLQQHGEIYVDGAFFGLTSNPEAARLWGNALVIGMVQTQKEMEHTIRVEYLGYEPVEHTRFYGTLSEYSISFRLKRSGIEGADVTMESTPSSTGSPAGGSSE